MHNLSNDAVLRYVNENAYSHVVHKPSGLWTTPVDKPVYNVENYEFSTVISSLRFPQPQPLRMNIPMNNGAPD